MKFDVVKNGNLAKLVVGSYYVGICIRPIDFRDPNYRTPQTWGVAHHMVSKEPEEALPRLQDSHVRRMWRWLGFIWGECGATERGRREWRERERF